MDGPICVIVNPQAGGGRALRLLPSGEAGVRGLGRAFRVERTRSIEHARELARTARDGGEIVAAMGGDGLIGAIAAELRGNGLLAVLPGGRGNDFARKLGLPQDPAAACEVLATGRERTIDIADAGGRGFLGIVSAGLDSDVQEIGNSTRLPLGSSVYIYAALRALAAWKQADWTVTIDGATRTFRGYSVAVANSGVFGGGMWMVPDASLDDGVLEVILLAESSKLRRLRGFPRVFKGTHVNEPGFSIIRGRDVTFTADRPFTAYADGEPVASLPLTVGVEPGALRVVAPR